MTKTLLTISSLAAVLLSVETSQAGHWIFVSKSDNTLVKSYVSDTSVTRGAESQITVTIPSGVTQIYGSGTFTGYGETDTFNGQVYGYSDTPSYTASASNYYHLTFKWVKDAPSDPNPNPVDTYAVNGYSLEASSFGTRQFAGGWWLYELTRSFTPLYNAVGPIFNATFYQKLYQGDAVEYPASGDADVVSINNATYHFRPEVLGGAVVIQVGSDFLATVDILNNQTTMASSTTQSITGPQMWKGISFSNVQTCFKAVTQIGTASVTY